VAAAAAAVVPARNWRRLRSRMVTSPPGGVRAG